MDNAERNGVRERFLALPISDTIIPLPSGEVVGVVISNPLQLPLPNPEANNPNYAGSNGRDIPPGCKIWRGGRCQPGLFIPFQAGWVKHGVRVSA